jgi:hypothetical protein
MTRFHRSSPEIVRMVRTIGAGLVALVFLVPAAAANIHGATGRAAVHPHSLTAGLSAASVTTLQDDIEAALGTVTVFAPAGGARGLVHRVAHTSARCGGELAFSPESSCLGACDASKNACEQKCSMGLNTCLTQCPMLGFACDAYCRAALLVCHGSCAREHDSCANACPARGSGESKGLVTNPAIVQ